MPRFLNATATLALLASTLSASPLAPRENDGDHTLDCSALWYTAPQYLANLTVNLAQDVSRCTTLNFTDVGSFIPPAVDVGPFCRFSGNITTSDTSSVRFEVWLPPKDQWNGHHLMVGNGGSNGFVRYDVMQVPVGKYGFAVGSTNNGHDGGLTDATYALQNPETQKDFGYRATHLTTVYTKKIIKLYYGQQAGLSYFSGCSAGGRQGLKEIQDYPEDYDAALIGAPAWNWAKQLGFSYYLNTIVNPVNTTRHVPETSWSSIYSEVLAQCDGLDGLVDGVIVRPGECSFDYTKVACGTASDQFNATTCLTEEQVGTLRTIYSDWKDPKTGEVIFQGYEIAAAVQTGTNVVGRPSGSGPGYYNYFVQNVTSLIEPLLAPPIAADGLPINETQLIDLIYKAQNENPGGVIAPKTNLTEFFQRGGKLLHYMGGADPLVPTNSSVDYYRQVSETTPDLAAQAYRYYDVPGMIHCGEGPGTGNFGQADQLVSAQGGLRQSTKFDEQHDAILALRAWREKQETPGSIIATNFVGDDIRNGTAFERPICPWPQSAQYVGGDADSADSFRCE